jgi:hypothetical protein
VKLWKKTAGSSYTGGDQQWSFISDRHLVTAFDLGIAHAGWSMEQWRSQRDPMFLNEVALGLEEALGAVQEMERRQATT